jgi:hypothetical protein
VPTISGIRNYQVADIARVPVSYEAGGGELVFADVLITHWMKIVITDPAWRPDPGWRVEGGFDHGKTNPTALERVYVDFDGNLIMAANTISQEEIWQHAPGQALHLR